MSESQGGRGGIWKDSGPRDLRLVGRAIRHGWAVPRNTQKRAVKRMDQILQNEDSKPRDYAAAVKVLLMASRVSLEGVTTTIKAQDHEDFTHRLDDIERRNKLEHQRRAAASGPFA